MFESGRANPHILALSEEAVLQIQNLTVPELVRTVDNSQITRVVIKFENLNNFNLKVKIKVFAIFSFGTNLWDILQF